MDIWVFTAIKIDCNSKKYTLFNKINDMLNSKRNAMKSVKMDRMTLLGIVKKNKETHVKLYEESVEDYKVAVVKVAEYNLEAAKTNELEKMKFKLFPTTPVSYENQYAKAIRMLELSIETEIDVEEDIFNQLVLDEWSWKNSFITSGALYKSY